MPYLRDVAHEAHDYGLPMMRAMVLEFPDDPACRYIDSQYMLGSALLVAPIFDAGGEVSFYLPEGEWHNLLTGITTNGPGWRKEKHGYLSLPLWVRQVDGHQWECLNSFHA